MIHQTLVEELSEIAWSDSARELCALLTRFSREDEGGAVVLIAAAVLLVNDTANPERASGLQTLSLQFRELMFAVQDELHHGPRQPLLRIVGGTEHSTIQNED